MKSIINPNSPLPPSLFIGQPVNYQISDTFVSTGMKYRVVCRQNNTGYIFWAEEFDCYQKALDAVPCGAVCDHYVDKKS